MAIWNKKKSKKDVDWNEMAKDLRADYTGASFAYRTTAFFK